MDKVPELDSEDRHVVIGRFTSPAKPVPSGAFWNGSAFFNVRPPYNRSLNSLHW
jgi:hypothetical protein